MTRTLSELAVMQHRFEEIQRRCFVPPQEVGDEITDRMRRLYMYELQLEVVTGSIKVLGHMMEDHPHDLDENHEDTD